METNPGSDVDVARLTELRVLDFRLPALHHPVWETIALPLPTRTSEDSPLRVALVPSALHRGRGTLGLTFAPGKKHIGLEATWDRDLATDLRRLREVYGTDLLVSLIEDAELSLLGIDGLFERAREHGIKTLRLPIPDGGVPANARTLASIVRQVASALQAGFNVVVHCRGGLGRAGLVTASILVGHGVDPQQAMAEVAKCGLAPSRIGSRRSSSNTSLTCGRPATSSLDEPQHPGRWHRLQDAAFDSLGANGMAGSVSPRPAPVQRLRPNGVFPGSLAQPAPRVAVDASGDYIVVWWDGPAAHRGVFARRVDNAGIRPLTAS